jgi:hypothetical protein
VKIEPIKAREAWCAVGPDGEIDIDLIRRGQAGCQMAATSIRGIPWPRLAHGGWRILRVRIVRADDPQVADTRPAPAQAATKPRVAPPPGYSEPDRMSAAAYRGLVAGIVRRGAGRER